MITKKVNRYYCEYCKKANCCAPAMTKHEKRCTNNPNRDCGMCKMSELEQPNLVELIAIIKADLDIANVESDEYTNIMNKVIKKLRSATEGCPACMLAAIRQSGAYIVFNFMAEKQAWWDQYNNDQREY